MRPPTHANPDWLDPIVVERFLDGCDPGRPLTPAEKMEVLRSMLRLGRELGHVCTDLGVSWSLVRQAREQVEAAA